MIRWGTNAGFENVTNYENSYTFNYPCISHENCYPYYVDFAPGVYQFECYGGVGGPSLGCNGGKAAITKGIIFIKTRITLFLYVGAKGLFNSKLPVFGGGGGGSERGEEGKGGGSGGGASDIRLYENDLYSRIMVAAGGGGSEYYTAHSNTAPTKLFGGDAGGLSGKPGINYGEVNPGSGGNQTNGGSSDHHNGSGSFGYGGNSSERYGSGGGGGYFGGGSGYVITNCVSSGGGGSSFINGYPGCTVNDTFSFYSFHLPQMITDYEGDPKIIITIISQYYFHSLRYQFPHNILLILTSVFLLLK